MKTDYDIKPGDTLICIKEHKINSTIVVEKGKKYEVVNLSYSKLYRNEEYPVITTTSIDGTKTWSLNEKGPYYLFSEYLMININQQRRKKLLKLKKINETNL